MVWLYGNIKSEYKQLDEYLESLSSLREKYQNQIDIKIGFEVEYLPIYIDNFKELKKSSQRWYFDNRPTSYINFH